MRVLHAEAGRAALQAALHELAVTGSETGGRTWAVVGSVQGAGREELMDLGRLVVRLGIGHLVVVGQAAGPLHAGAVLEGSWGQESRHVQDPEAAVTLLRAHLSDDDVVLVSGVPEVLTAFGGVRGGTA
ncbi:MAG TPA: hypothetical protein VMZ11_02300 [Mycobacteriales bacterium]|nr:hypothetical protein [Mycobacteriales bacterium]